MTIDLRAAQSPGYRGRGVARWATEATRALVAGHRELIGGVRLDPRLPPPAGTEAIVDAGLVTTAAPTEGGVYHLMGPFDSHFDARHLWPAESERAGSSLVVTVYDLIPEVMADVYLADPGLRRRYRSRRELVRAASRVVTLSQSSAGDLVDRWGLDARRVAVVGGAASAPFGPAPAGAQPAGVARRAVPGLGPRWIAYNGAVEPRKNTEQLVEAYARLPEDIRAGCQLVLVCALDDLQRHHFEVRAAHLGIEGRLVLAGYLPDTALAALYQAAELVAFPSRYEGFGLPVAEALACGAPVMAAGNSALAELVAPGATFDPGSVEAMAAALQRGIADRALRRRLLEWAAEPQPTWADVAGRIAAVYERLCAPPPRRRARPRVAMVTPWPGQRTGVADYSARLAAALEGRARVDVVVDGDEPGDPGAARLPVAPWKLPAQARLTGGYDAVVVSVGNSEYHSGALRLLRTGDMRPLVLAHDVNLTGLYRHSVARGAVPEGFGAALAAMYPGREVEQEDGWVPPALSERQGILMAREVIALSGAFLATSEYAAATARLDAAAGDAAKVGVWPFCYPEPVRRCLAGEEEGLVVSFGLVSEVKRAEVVVDAVAALAGGRPRARLVFVGPVSDDYRAALARRAGRRGIGERVSFAGYTDDATYRRWLARAAVAVQLRASSNGETSAAVADCLVHGLATVVSDLGPQRELPGAVTKVAAAAGAEEVAAAVASLLDDPGARRDRGAEAQAWAGRRGFDRGAEVLLGMLG